MDPKKTPAWQLLVLDQAEAEFCNRPRALRAWVRGESSRPHSEGGRSSSKQKDCIGNRWVLAIPRLLLLELLVDDELLAMDPRAAAAMLALPDDADLLFGVASVPARGQVGRRSSSRVRRVVVATFRASRPVQVRQLDVHLLVGVGDRLLLRVDLTVRRREDAEGDGDSCFKIQLDCPGAARRVVSSSAFFSDV